jgi:hypothetical protein
MRKANEAMNRIHQIEAEGRFWAKVQKSDGCWLWIGRLDRSGYGVAYDHRGKWNSRHSALAHRMAYELSVGPIQAGLTLDHLCRTRACVRPDHLRPCTQGENLIAPGATTFQAINRAKTHCVNGHEFTPENTYVRVCQGAPARQCRACCAERARRAYRKQVA